MSRPEARDSGSDGGMAAILGCAVLLLIVAAVFGGASRANPLRLMTVELAALPLAALAFRRLALVGEARRLAFPLALLAAIVAVPLLQLVPLPPALWTRLPGAGPRMEALTLAGLAWPWEPASQAPRETLGCLLALTPPAAMWLGAVQLRSAHVRLLAGVWIAFAAMGLALGVAQIAGGAEGRFYPYDDTNLGALVGFFANRNHEAAMLLALLPFAAHLAAAPPMRWATAARWLAGLFFVLAVVGLGVVRSRAGVIMAGPALAVSLAIVWRAGRPGRHWRAATGVTAAMAMAVTAVLAFGLSPILARFGPDEPAVFRFKAWPVIEAAVPAYLPQGAGVGSFDRIYRAIEPLNLVGPTFFNHAHNDYLELMLETGWLGAALFAAFLAWFARAGIGAWRSRGSGAGVARAASAAVLLLMALSVVDYPLRTETLATFLAFCCAALTLPPARAPVPGTG